eukprot:TRINITY_DN1607_c0_g3_i9.p1 TRINITY_DN1607_c0_g3~~TRINITY_DN1607_c0_g3_i9.p1  ORF type:complete len:435 (+),score=129.56 TRINITY_DN1607_c0_g3_i9:1129-2433(+)
MKDVEIPVEEDDILDKQNKKKLKGRGNNNSMEEEEEEGEEEAEEEGEEEEADEEGEEEEEGKDGSKNHKNNDDEGNHHSGGSEDSEDSEDSEGSEGSEDSEDSDSEDSSCMHGCIDIDEKFKRLDSSDPVIQVAFLILPKIHGFFKSQCDKHGNIQSRKCLLEILLFFSKFRKFHNVLYECTKDEEQGILSMCLSMLYEYPNWGILHNRIASLFLNLIQHLASDDAISKTSPPPLLSSTSNIHFFEHLLLSIKNNQQSLISGRGNEGYIGHTATLIVALKTLVQKHSSYNIILLNLPEWDKLFEFSEKNSLEARLGLTTGSTAISLTSFPLVQKKSTKADPKRVLTEAWNTQIKALKPLNEFYMSDLEGSSNEESDEQESDSNSTDDELNVNDIIEHYYDQSLVRTKYFKEISNQQNAFDQFFKVVDRLKNIEI